MKLLIYIYLIYNLHANFEHLIEHFTFINLTRLLHSFLLHNNNKKTELPLLHCRFYITEALRDFAFYCLSLDNIFIGRLYQLIWILNCLFVVHIGYGRLPCNTGRHGVFRLIIQLIG